MIEDDVELGMGDIGIMSVASLKMYAKQARTIYGRYEFGDSGTGFKMEIPKRALLNIVGGGMDRSATPDEYGMDLFGVYSERRSVLFLA